MSSGNISNACLHVDIDLRIAKVLPASKILSAGETGYPSIRWNLNLPGWSACPVAALPSLPAFDEFLEFIGLPEIRALEREFGDESQPTKETP